MKAKQAPPAIAPSAAPDPRFRSQAVARMAQMPVATLRVWEQRYRAVRPATAPSGHRLYSPTDVQRVMLLRQLTQRGHAIGSIAALDSEQLQRIALAPTGGVAEPGLAPARSSSALSLAVVGPALALRLQRPALARPGGPSARVIAVYESLADAARAKAAAPADLLLCHVPELQPGLLPALRATQKACGARRMAVVYRYAGSPATNALAAAGIIVAREPADDEALGAWLSAVTREVATPSSARRTGAENLATAGHPRPSVPPRRFDDAALTAIAGLSPTLACECPRHVAELLMQLSSFESYSAGCVNRHPADAQLHAYLQQVAGASRALFESALERVAEHEGLHLR